MITLLLASALAVADSTVYPVLNHDRPAGSMVVARHGDTTTVRLVFTDRNRGTRAFSRYIMRDGRVLSIENRPVLPDDRLGEPTFRFEIVGDSIRQWTPARARMPQCSSRIPAKAAGSSASITSENTPQRSRAP